MNIDPEIYPNPFTQTITIRMDESNGSKQIFIFDILGQIIYKNTTEDDQFSIDFSGFKSGVYIVQIVHNKKTISKKIIKK